MTWEDCHEKLIQELERVSQGVDWSCCQCIKMSSKKELQLSLTYMKPFLIRDKQSYIRCILPGLQKKKISGMSVNGLKYSFQIKVKSAFHLEIKVLDSVGRVKSLNPRFLKSSVTFWYLWWFKVSSVAIGDGWSALLCQVQSQHCHLHGAFRALHVPICCWHTLWRCSSPFPAGLYICPQCQN